MNDKIVETFIEEALELLEGLEAQLLSLEQDPANTEAINAAFRALHTIKGAAGMFGYGDIVGLAHKVETLLDHYRTNPGPISPEFCDLVLRSGDCLRTMLLHPGEDKGALKAELETLLDRFALDRHIALVPNGAASPAKAAGGAPPAESGADQTWRIRFKPSRNTYQRGVRPERLVGELAQLGKASVHCLCDDIPAFADFSPETCYVGWDVLLSTEKSESVIRDVFMFEEGVSDYSLERINTQDLIADGQVKRLGEILMGQAVDQQALDAALKSQRHIGEILVSDFNVPPEKVEEALFIQQHAKAVIQPAKEEFERKSIRVHSGKLDGLLNLVGELVTVQAQLSQAVQETDNRTVQGITDYIKRLIAELRTTSMDLRMVPLDSLFAKFRRQVRDLAKTLNKNMEIVLEGGDTEIDKSVIDALTDPLIHLIRNAADHGIESVEERRRLGKPECGAIVLSAEHAGAFVRLTLRDDGAGINHERVLARAVERGLIAADAHPSTEAIEALLFAPGFSTAAKVSSISGRGVGLDVVKTAIEQLGGTVSIQSQRHKGSVFILNIPLTMAIIDGFLARAGRQKFIIPLASVHSCFERPRAATGERLIVHAGELIPYASIRSLFGVDDPAEEFEEVVIVNIFDARIALGFDQILGGYQTVIKSIGELSRVMSGISGSAILADGGIALILDVAALATNIKQ